MREFRNVTECKGKFYCLQATNRKRNLKKRMISIKNTKT